MSQNIDQQSCALKKADYIAIDEMPNFNRFVRRKNTFIFVMTGTFLTIYILLPILAFLPILQQKVIGNITGVWVYSAGLFLMTIIVCTIYIRRAAVFDVQAKAVIDEYKQGQSTFTEASDGSEGGIR